MNATPSFSPEFLARYEILQPLAEGGMGVVYLARQRELSRLVAVKVLRVDIDGAWTAGERLLEEARLTARLSHPNIVPVYDCGREGDMPYLVSEYIEGETLADMIDRKGALPWEEVVAIGLQVIDALALAHGHQIIHRDLKPQNIIMRAGDQRPMVMDFGMAKARDRQAFKTGEGTILGTPGYMAPEMISEGTVTVETDIYALGCSLWEALSGRMPFRGDRPSEILGAHLKGKHPSLCEERPMVPLAIARAVERAIALRPSNRYPTAAAMSAALEQAAQDARAGLSGQRIGGTTSGRSTRIVRAGTPMQNPPPARSTVAVDRPATGIGPLAPARRRRHRRIWVLVVTAALLLGTALGGLVLRTRTEVSVRIEVAPDAVTAIWANQSAGWGTLQVTGQDTDQAASGRVRSVQDTSPAMSHALTVTGLLPARKYALRFGPREGPLSSSIAFTTPTSIPFRIEHPLSLQARIVVTDPARTGARLRMADGRQLLPESHDTGRTTFLVDLATQAAGVGTRLEWDWDEGQVSIQNLPTLWSGTPMRLVMRLGEELNALDVRAVIRDVLLQNVHGDLRSPVGSGLAQRVIESVRNPQLWTDMRELATSQPKVLGNPVIPVDIRLDLYQALLRLLPIDVLCASHSARQVLGIASLVAPVVAVSDSLGKGVYAPMLRDHEVPLLPDMTCFTTKEYAGGTDILEDLSAKLTGSNTRSADPSSRIDQVRNNLVTMVHDLPLSDEAAAKLDHLSPEETRQVVRLGILWLYAFDLEHQHRLTHAQAAHLQSSTPMDLETRTATVMLPADISGREVNLIAWVRTLRPDYFFEVKLSGAGGGRPLPLVLFSTHGESGDLDVSAWANDKKLVELKARIAPTYLMAGKYEVRFVYRHLPGVRESDLGGVMPERAAFVQHCVLRW